MIDFSTIVDRYEKDEDSHGIFCLEFSPDGGLLAMGTYDGKIRVRSLKMVFFSINLATLFRYGIPLANEYRPFSKHTANLSEASLSLLMVVLSSLDPTINSFAYGIYAMDRQRSCQSQGSPAIFYLLHFAPMDATLQGGI